MLLFKVLPQITLIFECIQATISWVKWVVGAFNMQKVLLWRLGYTNKMSSSRWHHPSTEAGKLAVAFFIVYCFFIISLGGSTLYAIWEWRHRYHFISKFGEETPFYWLFQRGGASFWVNFGGGWWSYFYLCPKLCWRLAIVSFYGLCSTSWLVI